MKVALCFWGQPRCIENEEIFQGIKNHILMNPAFTTDVYYQTWFNEKGTMSGSDWSGVNRNFNPRTLDFIFERYGHHLQRLIWMPQPNFLLDKRFVPLRKQMLDHINSSQCMVNDNNFNALCSQMVATTEIMNLVKNMGKLNQYDWIIFMRQDCLLTGFHDLNTLDPDKFYCGYLHKLGIKDDYLIFHPKYLDALNMIEGLQTYTVHPDIIPNSESIRYFQCIKYVKPENIIDLDSQSKYHKIVR
jgi:hypothetical protein